MFDPRVQFVSLIVVGIAYLVLSLVMNHVGILHWSALAFSGILFALAIDVIVKQRGQRRHDSH